MHVLQSLFSVLVDLYYTSQRFFACYEELPHEGLPPVVEIYVEAFGVLRSM